MAVRHGHIDTVKWLLDNGAEPSTQILNLKNLTPFMLAARKGNIELVKFFASRKKTLAWQYGEVGLTAMDLGEIDTWRVLPPMRDHHTKDNPDCVCQHPRLFNMFRFRQHPDCPASDEAHAHGAAGAGARSRHASESADAIQRLALRCAPVVSTGARDGSLVMRQGAQEAVGVGAGVGVEVGVQVVVQVGVGVRIGVGVGVRIGWK